MNWYFKPSFDVTDINNTSVEGFEKINLPHTVKELSYNCFSHEETAMVSTYMRKLTIPQEYAGRRAILVFVMSCMSTARKSPSTAADIPVPSRISQNFWAPARTPSS